MKKKIITVISAVGVTTLAGIIVLKNTNSLSYGVSADNTYTITFTSSNNTLGSESTSTVYTNLGNAIGVTHSGTSTATDAWTTLSSSGYIYNTDAISGMTSITIEVSDTDSTLTLNYGYDTSYGNTQSVSFTDGTTYTYAFESINPDYFYLTNESGSDVTITSMSITYSCYSVNNSATVTVSSENTSAGSVSGGDTYHLGSSVTVTATAYRGYSFTGWYDDTDTLVSSDAEYTFTLTSEGATLTAKFEVVEEMSDFTFTSSETSCVITGYSGTATDLVLPDYVTYISASAFKDCTTLETVTIPEGVTFISTYAFSGCTSLTSVNIPTTVSKLSAHTFEGCTSLTSITIPDSVTEISSSAFADCTALETVVIGDGCTSIGSTVFSGCTSLTSVTLGSSLETIGSTAFKNCTALETITIPDSVTSLGASSFYGCTSLKEVNLGSGLETIGSYAFYNCTSLETIVIPDSVTTIDTYAFKQCTALTSVTLGSSVATIGKYAFQKCTSLTSITIPDSVTTIDNSAFRECTALTTIVIGSGVTNINSMAFYKDTALATIYYNGTEDEWSAITFSGSYCNPTYYGGTVYYYSATEPSESGNYWYYVDGVPTAWTTTVVE